MGCENAFLSDRFNIILGGGCSSCFPDLFIQKLQCKETGVPLVHMKSLNPVISQGPQYSDAADAQNHFLTKPVMQIPSIEKVGERSVPFGIFRKIRIEKIDRDVVTTHPLNFVSPGTEMDHPAFNRNRSPWQNLF